MLFSRFGSEKSVASGLVNVSVLTLLKESKPIDYYNLSMISILFFFALYFVIVVERFGIASA